MRVFQSGVEREEEAPVADGAVRRRRSLAYGGRARPGQFFFNSPPPPPPPTSDPMRRRSSPARASWAFGVGGGNRVSGNGWAVAFSVPEAEKYDRSLFSL